MKLLILSVIAASIAVCASASAQDRLTAGMKPYKPGGGAISTGQAAGTSTASSATSSIMTTAQLAGYQKRTLNGQQQALVNGHWMALVAQGGGNWKLVAQGGGN